MRKKYRIYDNGVPRKPAKLHPMLTASRRWFVAYLALMFGLGVLVGCILLGWVA